MRYSTEQLHTILKRQGQCYGIHSSHHTVHGRVWWVLQRDRDRKPNEAGSHFGQNDAGGGSSGRPPGWRKKAEVEIVISQLVLSRRSLHEMGVTLHRQEPLVSLTAASRRTVAGGLIYPGRAAHVTSQSHMYAPTIRPVKSYLQSART